MVIYRDWITLLSVLVLLVLVGGFFGAVHPALDLMGAARPTLGVMLAVLAFFQMLRGHHLTALYIGIVAMFSLLSILGHAMIDRTSSAGDISMMQVNAEWDNALHTEFMLQLDRVQPGIVAMQDIHQNNQKIADTLARIYPYSAVCGYGEGHALAVYSKYPYADGVMPHCTDGSGFVVVPLETPAGVVHAGSIHVERQFIDGAGDEAILAYLNANSGRYLIAGDFSSAAWSHRVSTFATAADARPAPGLARTSGALMGLFGFRLNHVLVSNEWTSMTKVIDVPGSARDAVVAEVYVSRPGS